MNESTAEGNPLPEHLRALAAERRRKSDEVMKTMFHESDRGLVLVSAAYFEGALEELLRTAIGKTEKKPNRLVDPLFDSFGPLSTFAGKMKVGRAFDLLPEWLYTDLEVIRKMRNSLAHTTALMPLDEEPLLSLIGQLRSYDVLLRKWTEVAGKDESSRPDQGGAPPAAARGVRGRLEMSIARMSGVLDSMIMVLATDAPIEVMQSMAEEVGK